MRRSLLIAIDFDDTLTADPELWKHFIDSAKKRGHRIICVTARRDTEYNRETVDSFMYENGIELYTYFTSLSSKVDHMAKLGLKVDIWIDDNPRAAALGH